MIECASAPTSTVASTRHDRSPLRSCHSHWIHRKPQPELTLAYSTAKGALRTYSKGLAKGVASKGVQVTMISPGFIETKGVQKSIRDLGLLGM